MAAPCSYSQVFLCLVAIGLAFTVIAAASPKIRVKVMSDPRIPVTSFSCDGKPPGYYADTATGCQVYHMCDAGNRQYSYICPNQTLFHQRMLICAHWYQVNCSHSSHDVDANLLIGQRDKPFVGEDFWKHRFGGAGNTNFPPQAFPIGSNPGNTISGPILNADKASPDAPAKTTPSRFNKVSPTPQLIALQPPNSQFSQSTSQLTQSIPQFSQSTSQLTQSIPQFPQPTPQFPPPTPQVVKQPQFTFSQAQETQEPVRSPLPTEQLPVLIQPPRQGFGQLFDKKPSVSLETPSLPDQQTAFTAKNIVRPSIDLEVPFFDSTPQKTVQRKPSIELEPPIDDDGVRNVGKILPGFPPSKREDTKRPTQSQQSSEVKQQLNVSPNTTESVQSNITLDDRFTQVYILPTGKEPVKGPFVHPDLIENKVIFTDWNSLLKEKPEDTSFLNNYNEYVNANLPDEPEKEGNVEKSSEDLQREFSSNVARPFNFLAVKIDSGVPDVNHEEEESPTTVQNTFSYVHPSFDLLPPFGESDETAPSTQRSSFPVGSMSPEMTKVSFGNVPSFSSEFAARPSLNINNVQIAGKKPADFDEDDDDDDDSTAVIQNPFQHPFYKIKKMNDQQNIIFIPLTDSDFALELRKVPLNRTRVSRRIVRMRPLSGGRQSSEQGTNTRESKSEESNEEQHESAKCGHCHQGYLVDRQGCVPCVPLT